MSESYIQYPDERKDDEVRIVHEVLAPVVRSFEELREVVAQVPAGVTKVVTSGYFNPPHKNHVSNIVSSKHLPIALLQEHGLSEDIHLTVVVNGDWSARQKLGGKTFLSAEVRADIVRAFVGVDLVFINDIEESHQAALIHTGLFDVFTKGGDRDFASLPKVEQQALIETNTVMIGNVGFEKFTGTDAEVSSSKIRAAATMEGE